MSDQRLLTGALQRAGGGAGAFFLANAGELNLEFASREIRMRSLAPADHIAVVDLGQEGPFQVHELPPGQAAAWQEAAPWGRLFVPVFPAGQAGWMSAVVLAEAAFDPQPDFSEQLQLWAALAFTRRLLHSRIRAEQQRREAISVFLHHDLLQRSLYLKQLLMDAGPDSAGVIPLLDESVELIKQEVERQRPVLINQGIYFALQKLVAESRSAGIDLAWGSDFEPVEHPFTEDETAAGIYAIAAALVGEAGRPAGGGPVEMRLERPADPGRKLRLSIALAGQPACFSTTMALAFELAEMIGALAGVHQSASGWLQYSFEV